MFTMRRFLNVMEAPIAQQYVVLKIKTQACASMFTMQRFSNVVEAPIAEPFVVLKNKNPNHVLPCFLPGAAISTLIIPKNKKRIVCAPTVSCGRYTLKFVSVNRQTDRQTDTATKTIALVGGLISTLVVWS